MERTSEECLQRMEALVRRMANDECGGSTHARSEAREIVAELDASQDEGERWVIAKAKANEQKFVTPHAPARLEALEQCLRDGIAKGRELALAELKASGRLLT